MSNAKKNKGRDPIARMGDSIEARLVEKFVQMKEVDYMRNVVIPTLIAEGYESIDFNHGVSEVGKDLIFSRDKGFGKKSLVVAVVKSDSLSKSSSREDGLPVFLVQVNQASQNEVMNWDGVKKRPDEVLVIFADDPSQDIISANPGGLTELTQKNVQFILGSEIARSLKTHRGDIVEQILETELDTSGFLENHPTNFPLLLALHNQEMVDIKSIFTDLDASVGETTLASALNLVPSGRDRVLVAKLKWAKVTKAIRRIESALGSILVKSIEETQRIYLQAEKDNKSAENKANWIKFKNQVDAIEKWAKTCAQDKRTRQSALYGELSKYRDRSVRGVIEKSSNYCYQIVEISENLLDSLPVIHKSVEYLEDKSELVKKVQNLFTNIRECESCLKTGLVSLPELCKEAKQSNCKQSTVKVMDELERAIKRDASDVSEMSKYGGELVELAASMAPRAKYEVIFNLPMLKESMTRTLASLGSRFQSEEVVSDRRFARNLLEETRRYLDAINLFRTVSELSEILVPGDKQDRGVRLGACIIGLLHSGVDVLVTGSAGFGKSTTLEMYARQKYEMREAGVEVIFVPLAKLAIKPVPVMNENPVGHLCSEVSRLFRGSRPGITPQFLNEKIENAKKLVLVLDGIDEALWSIEWIMQLIEKLRGMKRDNFQLVASSRFIFSEFDDAGLLQIQLLPFKKAQVFRFVEDFLKNESTLAAEVVEHLKKNPTMLSVARTPLMSTILCVLARNGVVLPETANALYKARFELLWGAYDANKEIHRVKSSKACLEDVSKKAAFFLHAKRYRSAPKEDLHDYIKEKLARKYRLNNLELALSELVQPCNVLIPEIDGTLGFGHLSYQEYLVADELYTNRAGDIALYLSDPWWQGVLVLVAMRTDDIGSFIEQRISQTGSIGKAIATLNAMIEVSSDSQKEDLKRIVREQKVVDNYVDLDDMEYGITDIDSSYAG